MSNQATIPTRPPSPPELYFDTERTLMITVIDEQQVQVDLSVFSNIALKVFQASKQTSPNYVIEPVITGGEMLFEFTREQAIAIHRSVFFCELEVFLANGNRMVWLADRILSKNVPGQSKQNDLTFTLEDNIVINITGGVNTAQAVSAAAESKGFRDETAQIASQALTDIENARVAALQNIDSSEAESIQAINTARDNGVAAVNNARDQGVTAINSARDSAINQINDLVSDATNQAQSTVEFTDSAGVTYPKGAKGWKDDTEQIKSETNTIKGQVEALKQATDDNVTTTSDNVTASGENASDAQKQAQSEAPFTDSAGVTFDKGAKGYSSDASASAGTAELEAAFIQDSLVDLGLVFPEHIEYVRRSKLLGINSINGKRTKETFEALL